MKIRKVGIVTLVILLAGFAIYAEDLKKVMVGEFATDADGWELYLGKEFPGAEGNLWREEKEGVQGAGAASLEGNFSSGGNYVSMNKTFSEAQNVKELTLQVKTQDLTNIVLRLIDSTNQTFQVKIPLKDSPEWQTVTLAVKDLVAGKIMASWGGAGDGNWAGPAKGMSIVLDKGFLKVKENKKGSMMIDKVELKVAP